MNEQISMGSRACTRAEMDTQRFQFLATEMKQPFRYHRKLWEYVAIADVFMQRSPLEGRSLGFGVGREPLTAFFAGMHSFVTATDQKDGGTLWADSGQHADGLAALRNDDLCRSADFDRHVSFQVVDMNSIPESLNDRFDFIWSSCALEHLGTLQKGAEFILHSLRCLKPGGWMAHTTEFNVTSNDATLGEGNIVVYRQRDIEAIVQALRRDGAEMLDPSFDLGDDEYDRFIDEEPFKNEPHLKLKIGGFDSTSYIIIARRLH